MERLIEVEEPPFQRGRMIGEKFKELIKLNVDYYSSIWHANIGDKVDIFAKSCIPLIKDYDEEIFRELSGVAEGSGLTLEKIILLNSRYEALFLSFIHQYECTSFAVLPKLSFNKHVFVGQNWDLSKEVRGKDITMLVRRKDAPSYITNAEAGVLAHKGMNSKGIGICFNSLRSNLDKFKPCIPMLVVLRKLYDSKNFSDAIEAILKAERSTSANFLIAHKDGEAICVEVTPREIEIIEPDNGLLLHTNHFLSSTLLSRVDDLNRNNPDTFIRLIRMKSLFSEENGKIEVESLTKFMRDHFNWPESICRHGNFRTITSAIMDLNDKIFTISPENPCESDYESLKWMS